MGYTVKIIYSTYNMQSTQEKSGLFKELRDKLEAFPQTRCYGASECIDFVKHRSNVVHANVGYKLTLIL